MPQVALRAVSSIAIPETLWAMERCIELVEFGTVELLTDQALHATHPLIRVTRIEPVRSREEYSWFMLRDLARYVDRPHVLVVQWDGFVINPNAWTAAFLEYDYIGAPWPQFDDHCNVGNGGFSLRSKRLLDVTASSDFEGGHPEDIAICRAGRDLLEQRGMRFAPADIARSFSFERGPSDNSFGFHGLFNFPVVLDQAKLDERLHQLNPSMLGGRDGIDLIRALLSRGHVHLARRLARQRRDIGGWSPADARLWMTFSVLAARARLGIGSPPL